MAKTRTLKVRELIERLKSLPPDLIVTLHTGWEGPQHLQASDVELCHGPHEVGGLSLNGPHVLIHCKG